MSAARLAKAQVRDLLQGLGNHAHPTVEQPGTDWVTLAAATRLCEAKPRVVVNAARRGVIKVRWFRRNEAATPVPMLSRGGVEHLAAELRRERASAERSRQRRDTGDVAPTRARPWFRAYQRRIEQGLEECRHCGATEGLQVCRVERHKPWTMTNTTILCVEHAGDYPSGGGLFHWRIGMDTLADEEKTAPPERKWGLAAIDAARAR